MTKPVSEKQEGHSKVLRVRSMTMYCEGAEVAIIFEGGDVRQPLSEQDCDRLERTLRKGTHMSLTFEDQKSSVKGQSVNTRKNFAFEGIGQGVCGVRAAVRIIMSIMRQGGDRDTPVNVVVGGGKKTTISDSQIAEALRKSAREIGEARLGFKASELMCHGLRAGGATAMMLLGESLVAIEIQGRWAPGSGAVRSYLTTLVRTDLPCFSEKLGLLRGAFGRGRK